MGSGDRIAGLPGGDDVEWRVSGGTRRLRVELAPRRPAKDLSGGRSEDTVRD